MGEMLGVICGSCSSEFSVHMGAGMHSVTTRCDRCGDESSEEHFWFRGSPGDSVSDDAAERCKCGGTYTVDGPFRCPHCRKLYTEAELRELEVTMFGMWD